MSYQITPHFSLEEFFQSSTADTCKIRNLPDTPAELARVLNNITRTAHALEVLRSKLGRALRITSGYRCPALNSKVGGVSNSRHMSGHAVDIAANDIDRLIAMAKDIPEFTKIIPYRDRHFVHLECIGC